jgi:periplasmic protein TonB
VNTQRAFFISKTKKISPIALAQEGWPERMRHGRGGCSLFCNQIFIKFIKKIYGKICICTSQIKITTMENSQILQAELLDLLFEGRNKNYGAYELRKQYSKRMGYALLGTLIACLLFIVGNLLANAGNKKHSNIVVKEISLSDFKEQEKPKEMIPPKPIEKIVATEVYNAPLIVPDKDVPPDDEMKPVDALENVNIGNTHVDGVPSDGTFEPPIEASIGTKQVLTVEEDFEKEFKTVQMQARFPEGLAGWSRFLEKNLNSDLPVSNGAPPGIYTVIVSFVVDKEGVISDVKVENDPGYGTGNEAARAIRKGPHWIPAEQNGRKVIYRQKQSISFRVSEE